VQAVHDVAVVALMRRGLAGGGVEARRRLDEGRHAKGLIGAVAGSWLDVAAAQDGGLPKSGEEQ
jgi:hypothetical protein